MLNRNFSYTKKQLNLKNEIALYFNTIPYKREKEVLEWFIFEITLIPLSFKKQYLEYGSVIKTF